jgi:hypothetical protein
VVAGNESDGSTSKFSEFDDSGSSVLWTEEFSDEGLDYFAALDVVEAEVSPRVTDAEILPGRQELLSSPVGASMGEGSCEGFLRVRS